MMLHSMMYMGMMMMGIKRDDSTTETVMVCIEMKNRRWATMIVMMEVRDQMMTVM